MSQKYSKDDLEKMIPVFHINPETSTRVKTVLTAYVKNDERINDDQLDIDMSKELREKIGDNTLLISQINGYVLIGKYCACNIPGNYLVENTKLPVYYLSVIYNRTFITGCLFNIFLYFTMDGESKKLLNEPRKYYKALINGKFTIQFVPIDDNFLDKIRCYVEETILKKYQKEIENTKDEQNKDELFEKVVCEVNNEMNVYKDFLEEKQMDDRKPTPKSVYKILLRYSESPIFKMLSTYGLMLREKERIKERYPDGMNESYNIPNKVINLNKIKENPENLNAMMNNEINSDDECI